MKLLTTKPLNVLRADAEQLVFPLRYFWADIAAGDAWFDLPSFPPRLRECFQSFSALSSDGQYTPIDNHTTLNILR